MDTNWQSPILINLDGTDISSWFPKRNIWLDLQKYPIEEAVGAIRLRAQELGASKTVESAAEYLHRLSERRTSESARRNHERSDAASDEVDAEVTEMFATLKMATETHAEVLRAFNPYFEPTDLGIVLTTRGGSIAIDWHQRYHRSLTDADLYVRTYDGYVSVGDRRAGRTPVLLSDVAYEPFFDVGQVWRWKPDDESRPLTSAELAEHALKQLFSTVFRESPKRPT